jgi:hypothetical protein
MSRVVRLALLLSLASTAAAQAPDHAAEELRAEMVFWESVRSSTDPADFRAYLEQYPKGRFAALARNRLAALAPPPAAPVPAAPAAAAPSAVADMNPRYPRAGDSWVYRLTDLVQQRPGQRRKYTVTVTASAEGGIVDHVILEGIAPVESKHGKGSYLVTQGVTVLSPYLGLFQDLRPGTALGNVDTREDPSCRRSDICQVEGKVVGREVIDTPAGRFDTVKVTFTQVWRPPTGWGLPPSREVTAWYAAQAKRVVRVSSRTASGYAMQPDFDLELISYPLK